MYDTLNLWLPHNRMPNTDIYKISQNLCSVSERYNQDTSELQITGRYENLNLLLCSSGISIKGSICKYYLNQNLSTLTRGDTERAMVKLSDELHIPVRLAKVTRIDLAQNLVLRHEIPLYLCFLGGCQFYQRQEQNNGLYYTNQKRVKLFYGKVHEQQLKGEHIPELYKGKNVLRYELRFVKRLAEFFNCPEVTAELICDQNFYYGLSNQWENEYFSIRKNKIFNLSLDAMKSLKVFDEQVYLAGIKALYGGEREALEAVEIAKMAGVFDHKMQPQRLKEKIKKVCNGPSLTVLPEPIEELNQKVREVIKYYR